MALLLMFHGAKAASPLIILDPGHDPLYTGARGSCGDDEVRYNDRIAATYLKNSSVRIRLTRQPAHPPQLLDRSEARPARQRPYTLKASLQARTQFAQSQRADLFISIHHDSVASRFIISDKNLCGGQGGRTLQPAFREKHQIGFNIFIDQDDKNPHSANSLRFAKLLSKELLGLGRQPSNYHYFPEDDCRTCRPVERDLGIWHQQLYVLRHAGMPAVLIEVGNIVDAEDEAIINTDQFRMEFARALDRAVKAYFVSGVRK